MESWTLRPQKFTSNQSQKWFGVRQQEVKHTTVQLSQIEVSILKLLNKSWKRLNPRQPLKVCYRNPSVFFLVYQEQHHWLSTSLLQDVEHNLSVLLSHSSHCGSGSGFFKTRRPGVAGKYFAILAIRISKDQNEYAIVRPTTGPSSKHMSGADLDRK